MLHKIKKYACESYKIKVVNQNSDVQVVNQKINLLFVHMHILTDGVITLYTGMIHTFILIYRSQFTVCLIVSDATYLVNGI